MAFKEHLHFITIAVILAHLLHFGAVNADNPCAKPDADFKCVGNGCPSKCHGSTYTCHAKNDSQNEEVLECRHADLFTGSLGRDVGTLAVLFVFLAMSSAGGIGGGGVIIPILSVVTMFPPYFAVPLSSTAIVGASIVQFIFQIQRRHPMPGAEHRRLIDFYTIIILLPMALAGTVIGVNVNSVSPSWLILGVVTLVLTFTTYKTFKKGIDLRRKEAAVRFQKITTVRRNYDSKSDFRHESQGSGDEDDELLIADYTKDPDEWGTTRDPTAINSMEDDHGPVIPNDVEMAQRDSNQAELNEAKRKLLEEEAAFPWKPILITLFELGGVVVFSLIRGGSGTSMAGVTCGAPSYWGVQFATFLFLCLCAGLGFLYVKRQHKRRVAVNYTFVDGDIDYVHGGVGKYLIFALLAGFLAGFLGIGGGMVLAPMLLQLGIHPLVSAATTAYMTLFSAAGSFTQFIILERVPLDYGAALFVLACLASTLGQILVFTYVRKTGKTSVIAFILGIVICLAAIMLAVSGGIQLKDDYDQHKSFGFRPLCNQPKPTNSSSTRF
eukprot:gene5872-9069_t